MRIVQYALIYVRRMIFIYLPLFFSLFHFHFSQMSAEKQQSRKRASIALPLSKWMYVSMPRSVYEKQTRKITKECIYSLLFEATKSKCDIFYLFMMKIAVQSILFKFSLSWEILFITLPEQSRVHLFFSLKIKCKFQWLLTTVQDVISFRSFNYIY